MKNISLLTLALLCFSGAMAQTGTKAVYSDDAKISLVDVNVPNQQIEKVVKEFATSEFGQILPNSMVYNKVKNTVTFITFHGDFNEFNRQYQVISVNAETGKITSRFNIQGKILGSVTLPRENAIGIVVVKREFNPYQNNDESISFVILEEGTGRAKGNISLDFLSLNTPSMPFYGKVKVNSNDPNSSLTEFGISAPAYNVDKNQVVFSAIDVAGVNRLYVIDINAGKVISQRAMQEDIIDLVYIPATRTYKAMYFRAAEYGQAIYVADLNESTGAISNPVFVSAQTEADINVHIEDGVIRFDQENNRLFMRKQTTSGLSDFVELDMAGNEVINRMTIATVELDFKYPYMESQIGPFNAETVIKLYPNPAFETVQVATFYNDLAQRVQIYDLAGKLVKDVVIESGIEVNTLNISSLEPGIYTVDIHTEYQVATRRLAVQ